ncbi:acyltransferase family protein [Acidisoma cladoniae]|uniref:acyltransferase family protein n=1 Tax=Acidisoma cladoniae TaxID=3040935 RepID=UPI002551A194|nr:acyltransferase [Acidisoma sp. PAMC 29798]
MSVSDAAPLRGENRALTSVRGLAALWVVGHHISFELGYVGYPFARAFFAPGDAAVDIFFVLSGFVMMAVHRDLTRAGLGDFLTRRIFRIYPLHLTVLLALAALALWGQVVHGIPAADPWWALPLVAALLQPIFIHGPSWNVASWSLSVEMVCYLLFPLGLLWVRRLELVGIAMIVLILAVMEWHTWSSLPWGWPPFRRGIAGFALGMLAQQATVQLPRFGLRTASIVELAGLLGMIFVLRYVLHGIKDVPMCAAVLILGLASETGIVARLLGHRVFVGLGRISFSVYLLHGTLLALFFAYLPPSRLPFGHDAQGLVWAAGVTAVICGLGTITWRFVEEPARHLGRRLTQRRGSVVT